MYKFDERPDRVDIARILRENASVSAPLLLYSPGKLGTLGKAWGAVLITKAFARRLWRENLAQEAYAADEVHISEDGETIYTASTTDRTGEPGVAFTGARASAQKFARSLLEGVVQAEQLRVTFAVEEVSLKESKENDHV